ncbi:ethanolamine ammonia-lyase subunit EutC [Singulisphaera sp. PoT]|uniref:ethanolamine ammonia-lyase subunit EutC n=1 Tax=Singulisphaera sp. PoT TaxID=3411797 RepID=UPI003BF4BC18
MNPSDPSPPRSEPTSEEIARLVAKVRALTPARVLAGRIGTSYRTETQLGLREDYAAAVDAVHADIDLERDLGAEFLSRWDLFEVRTRARSKSEFLLRPDLGRQLDEEDVKLFEGCPKGADLQIVIGDGLSATAVVAQVPALLPMLVEEAQYHGLSLGRPFFIRNCRVGVLNDIGRLLDPTVVILLVGERPGLATAESLSAYLAYKPRPGHTDANRNLISNIHARGTSPRDAAGRVLRLALQMIRLGLSGVEIKEQLPEPASTNHLDDQGTPAR